MTPATPSSEALRRSLALHRSAPVLLFAEGTRSQDGRLGEFKRGPFTMAQKAGVRIVPVTITGVMKAMPPFALAPLAKVRFAVGPGISLSAASFAAGHAVS